MDKNIGDDFEFKPLTEGLGFHKKVIDLREETSLPLKTGILPKSKGPIQPDVVVRQKTFSIHPPEASLHDPWAPALKDKVFVDDMPKSQEKYISIAVSWPAALFDAAMIVGLGLLFSAVVFALTKIDLGDLTSMLRDEAGAQIAAFLLIVAVFEIYCVTCRSFFGKTLGEWAFDCRLGSPQDQKSLVYPLQVAWRTLIIAATGFIFLPIASTIFDRDLAGLVSGVSLQLEKR